MYQPTEKLKIWFLMATPFRWLISNASIAKKNTGKLFFGGNEVEEDRRQSQQGSREQSCPERAAERDATKTEKATAAPRFFLIF